MAWYKYLLKRTAILATIVAVPVIGVAGTSDAAAATAPGSTGTVAHVALVNAVSKTGAHSPGVVHPANVCSGGCADLPRDDSMTAGDYIYGYTDGPFDAPDKLIMQSDGNLVLYNALNQPCWASSTFGSGNWAYYQPDGNFVVYTRDTRPLWASNTVGTSGTDVNVNVHGQIWVGETQINPACVAA